MVSEEMVPKRIRQMRLERNLSQKALADAVGVTKAYISRMENANTSPPVGTLIALARALGVEFNAFFEKEDPEVYVTVTKRGERPVVARDKKAVAQYEHLALNFPNRAFESYVIKSSGARKMSQPNQHKGQELIYVLKRKGGNDNVNGQSHHPRGRGCHPLQFELSPLRKQPYRRTVQKLIGIIYNPSGDILLGFIHSPAANKCKGLRCWEQVSFSVLVGIVYCGIIDKR
jgi:transcriptional regulator with XRE-family HTH domain